MQDLASARLLLVCVYRPEQAQAGEPLLASASNYCPDRCTALHLHELDLAQSRQFLASLLAIEQLPEQTRGLILAKAQGNPFFLEEIVRGADRRRPAVPASRKLGGRGPGLRPWLRRRPCRA